MLRRFKTLVLPLVAALLVATCGPNATLMSPEEEAKIGAREHPRIVKQFGGVYDNPALTAYVENVLARMAKASDRPEKTYKVTVLDSPVVNAFALPGGYTYVTRGLLALANNEAELAGVIGHEIAHVTARHGARRQTTAVGTAILAGVLGVALSRQGVDQRATQDLVNIGGALVVSGFSRNQEYEADNLGIRALARAGYDPNGQAGILAGLGRQASFAGQQGGADWFASHPNTEDRVAKAYQKAKAQQISGTPYIGTDEHLAAIDGMIFGASESQGFVRGQRFAHGPLRLAFSVPKGFRLQNTPERVLATHDNGTAIIFDVVTRRELKTAGDYLKTDWAAGQTLLSFDRLEVAGAPAARASLRQGARSVHLLVVEHGVDKFMRFSVLTPGAQAASGEATLTDMARKIERLTPAQAKALKPYRIRIVTIAKGDTLNSLSRLMKTEKRRQDMLQMLNGARSTAPLKPGQKLKIIGY